MSDEPLITYYRAIRECRLPVIAADKSVGGSLPTQAFRYCEPMRQASGWGRYLFLPSSLGFRLDGSDVEWFLDGEPMGLLTAEPARAVQYPGFLEHWNRHAPPALRDYAPPWIAAHFEANTLQVWTGYFVRTQAEWSVLVRPPANLPPTTGVLLYEGIVESDWWLGPLFVAIKLTHEGRHVTLTDDRPFVQVVPVPRTAYRERDVAMAEFTTWAPAQWTAYHQVVKRPNHRAGVYATRARQRQP